MLFTIHMQEVRIGKMLYEVSCSYVVVVATFSNLYFIMIILHCRQN